jgi:hypothetical protein
MDVFALREKAVSDYKRYIESFVRIRDERIDAFVQAELKKGALWQKGFSSLTLHMSPGPRSMIWLLRGSFCRRLP